MSDDRRLDIFLNNPIEVFHSVEHRHEIWKEDPFDVESVHGEAREVFQRLLARATTPPGLPSGRVLLLLGDSGAGKTHLVRAFRNYTHETRAGFVGYMQMTSQSNNYGRYILSNLIDSLDWPYDEKSETRSGLGRLASALASRAFPDPKVSARLRDDSELGLDEIADLVNEGADRLHKQPRYHCADLDLLRALLFLHRPDPPLKSRVIKYLRCEDLSGADRRMIGGIPPRREEEDPERMVEKLGQLMWAIGEKSLVVCVDQIESTFQQDKAQAAFVRAMRTICDIADRVPSAIFVVCCLENFYSALRSALSQSYIDRIERDPEPVKLVAQRTKEEVEALVAARLRHLYTSADESFLEEDPLYPFSRDFIEERANLRTRDVLEECRLYREKCRKAGKLLDEKVVSQRGGAWPDPGPDSEGARQILELEQSWNDFFAGYEAAIPADDTARLQLLAEAIVNAGEELESGHRFKTRIEDGGIHVSTTAPFGSYVPILAGLCNKDARGRGTANQIAGLLSLAGDTAPAPVVVALRNSEFQKSKTVQEELKRLGKAGGRTLVIPEGDVRTMLALRRFRELHASRPYFSEWLAQENHLSQLPTLRSLLDLDRLERMVPPAAPPPGPRAAPDAKGEPGKAAPGGLFAGTKPGLVPQSISLDPREMTSHAAFLGGSGSGKTTLALALVEQLLLHRVPVVLVDRKGDLAGYAREALFRQPLPDPVLDERRRRLAESVDIALFTPGHPDGRPLAMSIAPEGLADMPAYDQEEAATHAAQALGDMLGYRHTGKDKTLRAMLIQAFQVLAALGGSVPLTLDSLVQLVAEADPALVSAVGRLDTKLFSQLVQDLETLKITASHLFSGAGEKLDVDLLLGLERHAVPGKTRLSVVSTKFLRDSAQILFWVSQLLMAVGRWTSEHPKGELQAVLLFDEADLYLPATGQPATKGPMENLLKRARSAGVGIFLATQSPGDLDYKCRDNIRSWFLGRIKEPVALAKLKPMLTDAQVDVSAKLPGQGPGEFHLVRERKIDALRAHRSVLATEQVPDAELLALARANRERAGRR